MDIVKNHLLWTTLFLIGLSFSAHGQIFGAPAAIETIEEQ
jgi:hypothetical protein